MKKVKSHGYLERGKVLYSINDFNLPFRITSTQMVWFVPTEFVIILFADLPPLNMIEGRFRIPPGIPVALTWFSVTKTFDGKEAVQLPKINDSLCLATQSDLRQEAAVKLQSQTTLTKDYRQLGVRFMF